MFAGTLHNDQKPRDYGAPFDDSDADVVLRSSDNADFRVYKVILAKSSPFFSDLFSIPQPEEEKASPDPAHTESTPQLPVIDVSEHSRILAMLLSMCYPLADEPTFSSLQELCSVLAAAKKYDMDRAYKTASRAFAQSSFLANRPARAYASVCRLELEPEARNAARACLRQAISLESLGEDIAFMDGPALHKLWRYHRMCGEEASSVAKNFTWITRRNGEAWAWAPPSGCCVATAIVVANNETWQARGWWTSYMARAAVALKDRPWGEVVKARELLLPSFQMLTCGRCSPLLVESLLAFSQVFAEEVERRINLVRMTLMFRVGNRELRHKIHA
ncbi:hypothetical protein EWM64_g7729 [Hericium alpestre]|uniref:BTB domain-containing protein n=1 Tax=Hericium alpestre TaxID=135208 RepID=A0A4Y9ZNU6_9AGAM|nr:hypothetical protein EWM64_g7729 [Hericium alpestre]